MPKQLWIGLAVFHGETDELLKQEMLDFRYEKHRDMWFRTAWWAMHEGHAMEIWACKDGEVVGHYDSREEVCQ